MEKTEFLCLETDLLGGFPCFMFAHKYQIEIILTLAYGFFIDINSGCCILENC